MDAAEAGAEGPQMNTVVDAFRAFARALEEARDLQQRGATADVFTEQLRHAHELLDIIVDQVGDQSAAPLSEARALLVDLRGRLESMERDVIPARH
jgi:hypothetical protein